MEKRCIMAMDENVYFVRENEAGFEDGNANPYLSRG
jgi:hypothetical protein